MQQVSIIVRTSTRYIFLERAIKDIKKQTFHNWKILLVNDGGDLNKIKSIIQSCEVKDSQINIIQVDTNIGLHKTINLGVKAVDTPYVVIHDDDDTWEPSFLEKTIAYLENNKACYGVVTHSNKIYEQVIGNKIKIKKTKPFNYQLQGVISVYDMLKNNLFSPISFVYRTEVYSTVGIFDETLEVLEDWEFNLRFLQKYDIYVLEESLANYHIRIKDNGLEADFKNTVTSKKRVHEKYDTIIRNRYLREDLEQNRIGLGIMMNILKWSDGKIVKKLKHLIKYS